MKHLVLISYFTLYFATHVEGCQLIFNPSKLQEVSAMQFFQVEENDNRIYLKPESILLSENKIYTVHDNTYFEINHIHSDATGYFIYTDKCVDNWFSWQCCRCQYSNGYTVKTCQNCHRKKCS